MRGSSGYSRVGRRSFAYDSAVQVPLDPARSLPATGAVRVALTANSDWFVTMNDGSAEGLTHLLHRVSDGDTSASEELLLVAYGELRSIAGSHMRRENPGHTLQPTALVHELWAKIAATTEVPTWPSRGHFFRWISKAMGNYLRDYARQKKSQKAGGSHVRITLEGCDFATTGDTQEGVLDILDAIEELSTIDDKLGSIVELRVFSGLSYLEIADALELTESQVDRSLQAARAWLQNKLGESVV